MLGDEVLLGAKSGASTCRDIWHLIGGEALRAAETWRHPGPGR